MPDDFFDNKKLVETEARVDFCDDFRRRFHAELASLPDTMHTVILSSEHFHSRIKTQLEVNCVRDLLAPHCTTFRIICYLREQAACCASAYSTAIKSGQLPSMSTWFARCVPSNHYYNHDTMLSLWESAFGFDAMDVSIFHADHFLNGNLLDDFTAKASPDLAGMLSVDIPRKNRSLSRLGLAVSKVLSQISARGPTSAPTNKIRKHVQRYISKTFKGAAVEPPLEVRQEIYRAFLESNEAVKKKFFPDLEVLFSPPSGS